MGNTPRARARASAPRTKATPPPAAEPADEALPPGRQRGANPNRMAAHLARMNAETTQELAAAHALVDELEAENAQLREAVAGLQDQLVAATSGNTGDGE